MKKTILFIVIALVYGISAFDYFSNFTMPKNAQASASSYPTDIPFKGTEAELVGYKNIKGGFDRVLIMEYAKIRNNTERTLKDFRIRCYAYGMSMTKLGLVDTTIYDVVAPGKTRTFTNVNVGLIPSQTGRSDCVLMGWENRY